jgi:alpha-glucosidase (family GH31 glycosyl hydrolase)
MRRLSQLIPAVAAALGVAAPVAAAQDVDAGSLRATTDGGTLVLRQPGHDEATLRLTATAPAGTERTVQRVGEGLIRVRLRAPAGTARTTARFARPDGERFLGFGERSDAVVRTSGEVQHRVTEGPYQPAELPLLAAFIPPPGFNARRDATYFPVPWLLSTRGYGVLVEDDPTSRHELGSPWSVSVDGDVLTLLVVAGPTPAEVLRRFTAHVGRQPAVAPEALGPWWQVRDGGQLSDEQALERLRGAGALGSIVQTSTHYLPCADHLARRDAERARTAAFEAAGLTNVTYFNPMLCTTHPRYAEARDRGLLTRTRLGGPYEYRYTGSKVFVVGQLDAHAAGTPGFVRELLSAATADGHRGWMEDFGEYTPDDAVAANGATGSAAHNAYPREYHELFQAAAPPRAIRYVRSGWTGSAKSSPVVWGGDPTTDWGFDGLQSAVRTGLSMGLSGVSRWGSDIGGFFALSTKQTSPELFNRWIQVGFASGVMRTQGNGFTLNKDVAGRRAEITDPDVLPVWARYAQLRTRLLPELQRAEAAYDATGIPVMRQLALAFPQDRESVARDDEWLLGDDLLVAPVLRPGQTERRVHLPPGRWVDLWRSTDAGLRTLRAPRVLVGGQDVTLPAPADELPILVRYGAALELLPTGGPSWRAAVAAGAARRSIVAFGGRTVRLRADRRRRFDVQWALARRPRTLRLDGRRVPFRFAGGVLRAAVRARGGVLRAGGRAR